MKCICSTEEDLNIIYHVYRKRTVYNSFTRTDKRIMIYFDLMLKNVLFDEINDVYNKDISYIIK